MAETQVDRRSVMILGGPDTGKTALHKQFLGKESYTDTELPTAFINYEPRLVKRKNIKIGSYDAAGKQLGPEGVLNNLPSVNAVIIACDLKKFSGSDEDVLTQAADYVNDYVQIARDKQNQDIPISLVFTKWDQVGSSLQSKDGQTLQNAIQQRLVDTHGNHIEFNNVFMTSAKNDKATVKVQNTTPILDVFVTIATSPAVTAQVQNAKSKSKPKPSPGITDFIFDKTGDPRDWYTKFLRTNLREKFDNFYYMIIGDTHAGILARGSKVNAAIKVPRIILAALLTFVFSPLILLSAGVAHLISRNRRAAVSQVEGWSHTAQNANEHIAPAKFSESASKISDFLNQPHAEYTSKYVKLEQEKDTPKVKLVESAKEASHVVITRKSGNTYNNFYVLKEHAQALRPLNIGNINKLKAEELSESPAPTM